MSQGSTANNPSMRNVAVDQEAETTQPGLKSQGKEWVGRAQDSRSGLFVFIGCWSKQRGVDPAMYVSFSGLSTHPTIQLITTGSRLLKTRVHCSSPYLFSGPGFALTHSRGEPFGLVAVEFGRKGTPGVGSRLGISVSCLVGGADCRYGVFNGLANCLISGFHSQSALES